MIDYTINMMMRNYYKCMLSTRASHIYDLIMCNIGKLAATGRITLYGNYKADDIRNSINAYKAIRRDHPEFFFLNRAVSVKYRSPSTLEILAEKRFTNDQIRKINFLFRNEVNSLIENTANMAEIKKEKEIYKRIISKYSYEKSPYSNDVSGLIVYRTGVCESLAQMLCIALREVNIPAITVEGRISGSDTEHCWNMAWVKWKSYINRVPYHLDVTFDLDSIIIYKYFNLTETEMLKDREMYGREKIFITK